MLHGGPKSEARPGKKSIIAMSTEKGATGTGFFHLLAFLFTSLFNKAFFLGRQDDPMGPCSTDNSKENDFIPSSVDRSESTCQVTQKLQGPLRNRSDTHKLQSKPAGSLVAPAVLPN